MSAAAATDFGRLRPWRAEDAAHIRAAGWRNQTGAALQLDAPAEQWLLLADPEDERPLACLRLVARLGQAPLPRYSYHLGQIVHAAAELGLFRAQPTLLLGNDHTGESELADLACAPELDVAQQQTALQRLMRAALETMAAQPERYGRQLLIELAGPREPSGASPFWQGLGAHFFSGDPAAAEARLGEAWRSHLAALLPRQTLYLSFLSPEAQAAVGQVGDAGRAAAAAAASLGFADSSHVRIDDGGPVWGLRLH